MPQAYARLVQNEPRGESTWTDEYRDIVDFFYWEPQHLGKIKNPVATVRSADAAWTRVAGLEVATNQILNFYLAIATLDAINDDESWAPSDAYRLVSSQQLEDLQRSAGGFTQADVLLRGQTHDCAIELKTKSRSTAGQVRKYAMLQALTSPDKPLTLVFLTPHRDVSAVFQEHFADVPALMTALHIDQAVAPPLAYGQVLQNLDVRVRTYADLFTSVQAAMLSESSPMARRVHAGLLSWLTARSLV